MNQELIYTTRSWINNLATEVEKHGAAVLAQEPVIWRPELQRLWNDNMLTVYEEIAYSLPLASEAPPNMPITREKYQELFAKVVDECQKGVWINMRGESVVAQKK